MVRRMFAVDEAAIRRVFTEEGELSAIVELRRRFPGVRPQSPRVRPDHRRMDSAVRARRPGASPASESVTAGTPPPLSPPPQPL